MQFFSPRSWRNLMFMISKGNFRPATYNAYFYPDYKWQPLLNSMGNVVNWSEFIGQISLRKAWSDENCCRFGTNSGNSDSSHAQSNQQLTLF